MWHVQAAFKLGTQWIKIVKPGLIAACWIWLTLSLKFRIGLLLNATPLHCKLFIFFRIKVTALYLLSLSFLLILLVSLKTYCCRCFVLVNGSNKDWFDLGGWDKSFPNEMAPNTPNESMACHLHLDLLPGSLPLLSILDCHLTKKKNPLGNTVKSGRPLGFSVNQANQSITVIDRWLIWLHNRKGQMQEKSRTKNRRLQSLTWVFCELVAFCYHLSRQASRELSCLSQTLMSPDTLEPNLELCHSLVNPF